MTALPSSRFFSYAALAWFASTRWGQLRDPQLRTQLHQQISAHGIAALPVIAVLAVLTGATAVTQATALVGQDNDLAQRLLFLGLFFELAPLFSALVVLARSSAAIASELAVMHLYDEFTALRRMGVPPADYLLLPRILGLTLALPAVTVCFQLIAVGSGWLAVALLQNQPLPQVAGHFLDLADPLLPLASLLKSALMGAAIAIIACHHGSSAERSPGTISTASIHAVGNGLVAVFVIDVAFALAAYFLK
ncbi:MAG: ABC transporter permease [Sulfuritalea sp.]|nr:ABC transporter permease [Sulfuritalea sp.]